MDALCQTLKFPRKYIHLMRLLNSVAKSNRFHSLMYTPEGKKIVDRLWMETMDEFRFADVESCLG